MKRRHFSIFSTAPIVACLFFAVFPAPCATPLNPFLHEFPADGKLEFTLEDKLHMPAFAWPRTLLSYAVHFPSPPKADQLRLPAIYEYAVTAVNGNGEGEKSLPADTDPSSWRNWNPTADLRFKRQSAFWLPPYVQPVNVSPAHYPEAAVQP